MKTLAKIGNEELTEHDGKIFQYDPNRDQAPRVLARKVGRLWESKCWIGPKAELVRVWKNVRS